MCSQLAYCWHINCAARHPAHLVMTSMEVRVRFSLLSCLFVLVCRLACEPVALCLAVVSCWSVPLWVGGKCVGMCTVLPPCITLHVCWRCASYCYCTAGQDGGLYEEAGGRLRELEGDDHRQGKVVHACCIGAAMAVLCCAVMHSSHAVGAARCWFALCRALLWLTVLHRIWFFCAFSWPHLWSYLRTASLP